MASRLRPAAALLSLALVLAGCGPTGSGGQGAGAAITYPPESGAPGPTVGPAVAAVRAALVAALAQQRLVLGDAKVPFRPAESAEFAAAPRAVFQVELPSYPSGGFISVYEFHDAAAATAAAQAEAAYLASGPGRVQSPAGTVHVIRVVATTVIYYRWLPAAETDPTAASIQTALETIGVGVTVPG